MRSIFPALLLLLIASAAPAQDQEVLRTVDWETGTLLVTIRRALPAVGPNRAAAVSEVSAEIERDAPAIVVEQLRDLQYDSARTIEDLLGETPRLINALTAAANAAVVAEAHATTDLRSAVVTLELDLYADLLSRLTNHERPVTLRGTIGWTATANYTGIVIYAADELSVHGTDTSARLQPALFPGIYYQMEDGQGVQRLMEADHVDPRFAHRWGPVYYTDDPTEAALSARVGDRPLLMIAYGAFGKYPTDVVISYQDALRILGSANNRSLIAEGRVAIVLDSGQM